MEKYFDKNGREIKAGMYIRHDNGEIEKVYEANDGDLGISAGNENWSGFNEFKRELYPLSEFVSSEWNIVEKIE